MKRRKSRYSIYNILSKMIAWGFLFLLLIVGVSLLIKNEVLIPDKETSHTGNTLISDSNAEDSNPSQIPSITHSVSPSPTMELEGGNSINGEQEIETKQGKIEQENDNNRQTSTPSPTPILLTKEEFDLLPATSIIDGKLYSSYYSSYKTECFFYSIELSKEIKKRITGISFKENDIISYDDLRYIRVLHYGFDSEIHIGELIVNKEISNYIVDIFHELFEEKYPIEKMVLIDDYNGDDEQSMKDNNTSAFNYRPVTGSSFLSKHSMGLAIDINPLYNPYVKEKSGTTTILPKDGKPYADRSQENKYFIKKDDTCYQAFVSRGFTWGGNWNSLKDYQHFEISLTDLLVP